MDNISIDFKKLLPYIIDAFTEVYGEEYHDIIKKRINNALILQSYDIEALSAYILNIKNCKKREYAIKFLDKIGMDVDKYKKDSYIHRLDDKIEDTLHYYISGSYFGFCDNTDYFVPLQAFKQSNKEDSTVLLENKILIINYLLHNGHEKITAENFDAFTKKEEYQKILEKIDKLNNVYEPLLVEYRKWEEQLKPYEEFVQFERKRKKAILKSKKHLLFMDIYFKLPAPIIKATSNKIPEEKIIAILGDSDIGQVSDIESFSYDKMEKLKSKNVPLFDKFLIVASQVCYLNRLGIDTTNEEMIQCNTEEDVKKYLNFINQENIKQYIPSNDLINYITSTRKNRYDQAIREYYMTRKDFTDITEILGNNESEYLYEQLKRKGVCITPGGATRNDGEFISLMFYTIRDYSPGNLCYTFMHECGHIIDQSPKMGSGFESFTDFNESSAKNPYDYTHRKYERFNEALNDIFTIEALEFLHKQDLYLIEPQEFTLQDVNNHNTTLITKNILRPLLSKFRQQVISAKVKTDRSELTNYIGQENFEELVDVVNKVDYLSEKGVVTNINKSSENVSVKEYFYQLERAEKIYNNIDNYYSNNVENSITSFSSRKK